MTSSLLKRFGRTARTLPGQSRQLVKRLISGVFGGPPCQGVSDIGRRDVDDPRRQLLGHFFRIVSELRPTFFVMENVRGLAYADVRGVLDAAIAQVSASYHILGPTILAAANYGARSAERSVGKECVSTFKSRLMRDH